jgi:hypothetical protein
MNYTGSGFLVTFQVSTYGIIVRRGADMLLNFEGQAIIDAAGGVRFVGQYDAGGQIKIVICRIEREALLARCGLRNPTAEDLLNAYRSISVAVNRLAAAQFAGGIEKPIITAADLNRVAA